MLKAIKSSLNKKLLTYFLIISIVPVLILAIAGSIYYAGITKTNTYNELNSVNNSQRVGILQYLHDRNTISAAISNSQEVISFIQGLTILIENDTTSSSMNTVEVRRKIAEYDTTLRSLLLGSDFSDMFFVTAAPGANQKILYSTESSILPGTPVSEFAGNISELSEALQKSNYLKDSVITNMNYIPSIDSYAMFFIQPVRTMNGATIGYGVFTYRPYALEGFVNLKSSTYETEETFIVNSKSELLTSRRNITSEEPVTVAAMDPVTQALSGESGVTTIQDPLTKQTIRMAYSALEISETNGKKLGVDWAILTVIDKKESLLPLRRLFIAIALFGLFFITITIIIAFIIAKNINIPILTLTENVKKLSDGYLDFSGETKSIDEIGVLFNLTETMVGRIKAIVLSIKSSIADMEELSGTISTGVEEQSAISAEQAGSITEISSTMDEFTTSLAQVSENIHSVSVMSEKMFEHIQSGARITDAVADKIRAISADNEKNISEIMELRKKSRDITKVMEIINSIADQTKIIAFNAALEASSAGEYGKRFGVVALEIRKLAESVMSSTANIEHIISEIQESANHMVIASEKTTKSIQEGLDHSKDSVLNAENIVNQVRASNDAARQISLAIQQQQTAASQIQTGLKELSEGAHQNSEAIRSISTIGGQLTGMSKKLRIIIQRFKIQSED